VTLEVACETAIAADPCECSLDDPSLRQDDEVVKVGSFDDLDPPVAGRDNGFRHLRPLIPGIGKYLLNEWEPPSNASQQIACAVTVLNVGWQNPHAEQEAEAIDEDVALAARDLLARIEALRINRRAPF